MMGLSDGFVKDIKIDALLLVRPLLPSGHIQRVRPYDVHDMMSYY